MSQSFRKEHLSASLKEMIAGLQFQFWSYIPLKLMIDPVLNCISLQLQTLDGQDEEMVNFSEEGSNVFFLPSLLSLSP